MKLREVLNIIRILLNKEEEKIYISDKSGYLLKDGKILSFDDKKNKQYETKYTVEEFIDIQYNNAFNILTGIEIIHRMLACIPSPSNINLYDSDISVDLEPYPDGTPMSSLISIKSMNNNHLILITYWQSDYHGFEMRTFDIDLASNQMVLGILKGNDELATIDYYTSSGNLSKKSLTIVEKEKNGENRQSTLNTSYDMYFEYDNSSDNMIEKIKRTNCLKLQKKDIYK